MAICMKNANYTNISSAIWISKFVRIYRMTSTICYNGCVENHTNAAYTYTVKPRLSESRNHASCMSQTKLKFGRLLV